MSEILQAHACCPDCGSSDALTVYDDHSYCFSCKKYTHGEGSNTTYERKPKVNVKCIPNSDMEFKALSTRGISKATCSKFGYYITRDDYENVIQVANYCGDDGSVRFQKTRGKNKRFGVRGESSHIFFGQHLFTGGKRLVITEGEIDALSYAEITGNKYPVVSIPFGCKSAKDTFRENLDWLNKFDEVVVMFDMDEHGQKAVKDVGGILPPHKLKIAKLPLKDANECLVAGRGSEVVTAMWNAEEYRPDGIVNARDLKERMLNDNDNVVSYNFPWCEDLNKMVRGIRKDELTLLTAGSGIGKSTFAREIAYDLQGRHGQRVGLVMLEEKPTKTVRDILSIHLSRPLHLNWEESKEEAMSHYDELFGAGNFILYDHFGSLESDNLLEKIRYMAVAEECSFIILDHISIAISGLETNQSEVKVIDVLMTKLRQIVAETGVGIIVVSHLRKTDNKSKSFEEGGKISGDDLRGSAALKQLSDTILAFERNQQAEDENLRNLLRVRVLKCRFTGETGPAETLLEFDKNTYRIKDASPEFANYEEEESNGSEF